ncbi:MAG: histidine kinase [Candidatus Dormiibacterota bacterium]
MSAVATPNSEPLATRRLARPATAWLFLSVVVAMYVAFGVVFYSPLTSPALFRALGGLSAAFVFPFCSFAIVGAVIATRRPANPVGWLCIAGSAVLVIGSLAALVGSILIDAHNGFGRYVLLLSAFWNSPGGNAAMLFLVMLLVFPDGRLLSPKVRWLVYAVVGFGLSGLILGVINPTPGTLSAVSTTQPGVAIPVSVLAIPGSAPVVNTLSTLWNVISNVLTAGVIVAVFLRLRGADSDTRHQIKWVASAALFLTATILLSNFLPITVFTDPGPVVGPAAALLVSLAVLSVPVAIGVAVLKYRLYDIDLIISRTLVYGVLAASITAVYIGIAVGIGTLVGSGGQPNLWLSIVATIIVAIGFQPVRERVQKIANRLVYGKRATPYEVLTAFSDQVAEAYAADEVLPRMARVLQEATGAQSATVWLKGPTTLRAAATHPNVEASTPVLLPMSNGSLPEIPGATTSVPVEHQGRLLGALSVVKRRGDPVTPTEQKLIDDLAHQAGLVLRNVGLTAELHQRLDELRASRQRLVRAQDEERRRIERNLHDGAQQHLVALKVKLGLAQMLAATSPEKAKVTLVQLKADADEALETLRDLARGIYPPLLADRGLVAALESQVRKAMVQVRVDAEDVERYAQDVEATVYFCVLEALQNVQKYANASQVVVRLRGQEAGLTFEIEDDGTGFDTATVTRGAGLTNMVDRVEALGGNVDLTSAPGSGTRVSGNVPATVRAAVPA